MLREHSEQQAENATAKATRPIYLVCWEHSGTLELLSCNGRIVFNAESYSPSNINVKNIKNGQSATLQVPADIYRTVEVQSNSWRDGVCKIYAIPASPTDSAGYTSSEAILVLNGKIISSSYRGDWVTVRAVQNSFDGSVSPRIRLEDFGNHMPAPGEILAWEGDQIVLVAGK